MSEQLRTLLQRLPVMWLLFAWAAYLGYDYYTFTTDPSSPLKQQEQQVAAVQQETTLTREKVKKAQDFYRTLEQRKSELRTFALQLEEAKASLSEQMDVSSFIRMVVGEAGKVGMNVLAIRPTDMHQQEYYVEQSFDLKFHGVFVQLVVFLQRLSNLERIIRVGKFDIKPVTLANNQFVELEGDIQLNTYRYRGSKADDLVKGKSSP